MRFAAIWKWLSRLVLPRFRWAWQQKAEWRSKVAATDPRPRNRSVRRPHRIGAKPRHASRKRLALEAQPYKAGTNAIQENGTPGEARRQQGCWRYRRQAGFFFCHVSQPLRAG